MKRPRKLGLLLGLAVFGAVLFNLLDSPQQATAANPTTMSFQGKVVNADGTNVADGTTYSILFKLYTVSSAGSAIWTETQTNVTVSGGVFQVNLGSVCPFFTSNACNNSTPIDFNANPNLYLGITFNGDAAGEMTPRPQLQSVPYAFQADNASKLGGLAASNYVQLSPSGQQTGNINVNGSGTFGGLITGQAGTTGLALTGAPVNTATTSLLQLGGAIAGGNTSVNGGTYLGINEPASGNPGTAADFLNFQNNGTSKLRVTTAGALTAGSTLTVSAGGLTVTLGGVTITAGGLNVNSTGITNAGSIGGATTIAANNTLTLSGTGANELAVTGAPSASATSSLIQLGGTNIASGNSNGTYIGLNAPTSGAGSAADFVNLQIGGVSKFKVDITGIVTATTRYSVNGSASLTQSCAAGRYVDTEVITGGIAVSSSGCTAPGLSDQRLKKDIVSLDSTTLDAVKQLNPVHFNFDCSNAYFSSTQTTCATGLQTGVIAQQLAPVFPDLVYQDDYGYYNVNYQGLSIRNLEATREIARHLDSQGNATLNDVTVNHLTVNGGTTTFAETANYSSSVMTPLLVSSGALVIISGSSGDVTIDSGGNSAYVNIGSANATGVNIARAGATTEVKGALAVDQAADFGGNVTMHFKDPETAFRIDNSGSTQAVVAAIQIKDSTGTGYTSLISTPNFNVAGNGDITGGSIIGKGGSFQLLDPAGQQLINFDQAGNGNFKGNLNLSSAALSGGLTVGGDVNVAGLSTFQKLATFIGKTIFRQDVQFDGHITVSSDSAGYAKLRIGESVVHVTYKTPYETVPVISTNIVNGQYGLAGVNNITKEGFDISLPAPATADTTLSWTAVAVTNPQTAVNPEPSPAPSPAPAPSPTPAPAP